MAGDGSLFANGATLYDCAITGGALKMGNDDEGYHTWISEDGVLNASGAHIDGTITAAGDMGVQYPSLVSMGEQSPVCFEAGGTNDEVLINEETLTFTSNGDLWSQTISLNDEQKITHLITNAKCLTFNKVHEGSGTSNVSVTSGTILTGDGYYYSSTTVELFPSWVSQEHIVELSVTDLGSMMRVSYLGDGKVLVSVNAPLPNITYLGVVNYHYLFDENLDVSVDIAANKDEVTFSFYPQTINVEYAIDVQYIFEPKDFGFKVLRDGSLYANEAYIRGRVYATDGEFTGTIYATDGEFNGTVYATNGDIGGLKIDDGIKGYVDNTESFSLTPNGLIINDTSAKIQVGNFETFHDASSNHTCLQTNGALCIQGMESGKITTSIEMMSDTGENSTDYEISLHYAKIPWVTNVVPIQLKSDKPLLMTKSYTIYYQFTKAVLFGTHDYDSATTRTIVLTIEGGQTESSIKNLDIVDEGALGLYMRFKCLGDWLNDDKLTTDLSNTTIGQIDILTQTQPNNNILITGNLVPKESCKYSLGEDTDRLWSVVYAQTGSIQSSDRNKKNNIKTLSYHYTDIFDNLNPVSYKFNDNTSDRTHIGFIAQDVKSSIISAGLTTQDFAGYCEWENNDGVVSCGLRYEEFIALCVNEIQKLKKRVAELENK